MSKNPLKQNSGKPVDKKDIKEYTQNFKKIQQKKDGSLEKCFDTKHGKREGEFFGKERINQLISLAEAAAKSKGNECIGVRAYYGLAYEEIDENAGTSKISTKPIGGDDSLRPRLFLVGVDQNGKDIDIDMSQLKDPGDVNGLGDGLPIPPYGQS